MKMKINMNMKKITIITGRYGCGKTNLAANLAVMLADSGKAVTAADLDIVNPYFRTADFSELFKKHGIKLNTPMYANTSLDIPAVSFDIERLASDDNYLIIDVGGDDTGAAALGRYAKGLMSYYPDRLDMWYVVNRFRSLGGDIEEELEYMRNIETASKLKCTGIVGNNNLGCETDSDIILQSAEYVERLSQISGLPVVFSTYPENVNVNITLKNSFPVKIYVKPPWERKGNDVNAENECQCRPL